MAQVRAQRRNSTGALRRRRRRETAWTDATSQLRRAYFAHGGELALRYGITFDRVAQHIHRGWNTEPALFVKGIRYAEDLVHVVACIDGVSLAWSDLSDHHERMLMRACRDQLDETEAILVVRRLFVELRRPARNDSEISTTSLERYLGTCSLRGWLCRCLAEVISDTIAYQHEPAKPMRFCEAKVHLKAWDDLSSSIARPAAPAVRATEQAIDYPLPAAGDELG